MSRARRKCAGADPAESTAQEQEEARVSLSRPGGVKPRQLSTQEGRCGQGAGKVCPGPGLESLACGTAQLGRGGGGGSCLLAAEGQGWGPCSLGGKGGTSWSPVGEVWPLRTAGSSRAHASSLESGEVLEEHGRWESTCGILSL